MANDQMTKNFVGTESIALNDLDLTHEVSVEVVYKDEDLIELETVASAGHWRGRARAYTVPQDIAAFASALDRFVEGALGSADFTAGDDKGMGLLALRIYRVDRAGHIACHIRLASGGLPTDHRPEQVSQFAVEVSVEAWAVSQFSRHLAELARSQSGRASLAVAPEA